MRHQNLSGITQTIEELNGQFERGLIMIDDYLQSMVVLHRVFERDVNVSNLLCPISGLRYPDYADAIDLCVALRQGDRGMAEAGGEIERCMPAPARHEVWRRCAEIESA